MSLKILTKILLVWAIAQMIIVFNGWLPEGRTQTIEEQNLQSQKSIPNAAQLIERGKAKLEQEDYRSAIALISRAIQLEPENPDYYFERGSILGKLGDKEAAIRDFDSTILRNPNHAWAYLRRAGMSFYLGFDRLTTDDRGTRLRTTDYSARNGRAMLDLQTAKDLFARQGDRQGYQLADSLMRHFGENK